jgi:UPF0755 protein
MNPDQRTRWEDRQRREARIRDLRDQRASMEPRRRRFQPLILLGWFAAVAALAAVVIAIGFVAFAPRLMAWVEENPGLIRQGVVLNFVEWYQPAALADVPAGASKERITIEVPTGASASGIAQILVSKGVIRSELTFQYYVYQAGREGTLQAGTYDLSPSLTPSQIVAALRQLKGTEVKIRIQEGWRLEQIVGYLGTTRLTMNLEDFTRLVKNPPADLLKKYAFFNSLPVGRTLEGYLFPDTYQVDANTTARALVEKLLDTFNQRLSPALRAGIAKQRIGAKVLTIDQAVALASIVEREAVKDSERALIAGVYLNRMNTGGETAYLLQADPTLQWALATEKYVLTDKPVPISGWEKVVWWPPLETGGAQVKLAHPELLGYQTYVHALLPPTPIAAPRLASLAAVAAPNRSAGYFFFVAACPDGKRDGSHYFAKTYAEQQANIAKANAECPPG